MAKSGGRYASSAPNKSVEVEAAADRQSTFSPNPKVGRPDL
jgi:hypothetical protein